jgi:hypothetical protein
MDARDRYMELLMEKVRDDRYPSGELLDRIELALRTRSQAAAYLELLHAKVSGDRYPSGELLNRIERSIERTGA